MTTPILDTHVHFWDHDVAGMRWPWLEKGFKSSLHSWTTERASKRLEAMHAARSFTSAEFRAEVAGVGVAGLIHAHAASGMDDAAQETRWVAEMARKDGWPVGIIGSCNLAAADGPDLLRRHRAASEHCRSVRDMNGPKGIDVDACADTLAVAEELGFSIEMRTAPEKFDMIAAFVDRWPNVNFVLSHASLPLERTPESLKAWIAAASDLAKRPNVRCKISALCGGSDPDWTIDSIRPWAEACYGVFGPDRAMLGTNWPVDRLFGTYGDVVNAYRTIFAPLSESDRSALFYGNAAKLYGVALTDLTL
ncbi:MAG: amidohydrolase family protein [Actinomycetia bacterium]|nr:amidohydrolase family protein [Actinomycetes bacterium]